MADLITIDDFKKVELRAGVVKAVEPHPNADKLLVLKVDVGGSERQLVAGIRGQPFTSPRTKTMPVPAAAGRNSTRTSRPLQ